MVNNLFYYSASANLTTKGGKLAKWILNQHEACILPLTTSQSTCLLMILNIQKAHPQLAVLAQFSVHCNARCLAPMLHTKLHKCVRSRLKRHN